MSHCAVDGLEYVLFDRTSNSSGCNGWMKSVGVGMRELRSDIKGLSRMANPNGWDGNRLLYDKNVCDRCAYASRVFEWVEHSNLEAKVSHPPQCSISVRATAVSIDIHIRINDSLKSFTLTWTRMRYCGRMRLGKLGTPLELRTMQWSFFVQPQLHAVGRFRDFNGRPKKVSFEEQWLGNLLASSSISYPKPYNFTGKYDTHAHTLYENVE